MGERKITVYVTCDVTDCTSTHEVPDPRQPALTGWLIGRTCSTVGPARGPKRHVCPLHFTDGGSAMHAAATGGPPSPEEERPSDG